MQNSYYKNKSPKKIGHPKRNRNRKSGSQQAAFRSITALLCFMSLVFVLFFSRESRAQDRYEDSILCENLLTVAEHVRNIPSGLLRAISRVETGRDVTDNRPWPWVLRVGNAEGLYYDDRETAEKDLIELIEDGEESIDVGCMQINTRYHGEVFSSPEAMLNPIDNVAYGAQYLLKLFERHGTWGRAVEHYHSSEIGKGRSYVRKVSEALAEQGGENFLSGESNARVSESGKSERAPAFTESEEIQNLSALVLDIRQHLGLPALEGDKIHYEEKEEISEEKFLRPPDYYLRLRDAPYSLRDVDTSIYEEFLPPDIEAQNQ